VTSGGVRKNTAHFPEGERKGEEYVLADREGIGNYEILKARFPGGGGKKTMETKESGAWESQWPWAPRERKVLPGHSEWGDSAPLQSSLLGKVASASTSKSIAMQGIARREDLPHRTRANTPTKRKGMN